MSGHSPGANIPLGAFRDGHRARLYGRLKQRAVLASDEKPYRQSERQCGPPNDPAIIVSADKGGHLMNPYMEARGGVYGYSG